MKQNVNHIRVLVCLLGALSTAWAGRGLPAAPGEPTVPNQYVLKMKTGWDGGKVVNASVPGAQVVRLRQDFHLVIVPQGTHDSKLMNEVAGHPGVDFVEPNRVRSTTLQSVSDPGFSQQWALQTVQAIQAWTMVPGRFLSGSSAYSGRVKVAVLDTGTDCTHPDFANSGSGSTDSAKGGQLSFASSSAPVATTISSPACAWQDDYGHGTHVAGIIAAAAQNGVGVIGLGYPLELITYKVLSSSGSGDDATISNAIMSAADAGARIISLSLGGAGYSQVLQSAVNYAWEHDALVVAAAGNESSSTLFFPAGANFAVGVSATDSSNNPASFSNFGDFVKIAAPGVSIYSTVPTYSNPIGVQNYALLSGTSMATPFVSALAGLIATATPGLPAAAILERIQQSASSTAGDGGWNRNVGYGVINAATAVSGAIRPASRGAVSGQVIDQWGYPVYGANISINGQTITTDSSGLFRFGSIPAGTYPVQASASGYGSSNLGVTVTSGADAILPITMNSTYGQFTGAVNDVAGPVAGAVVQAISNGLIKATTLTDAGGRYTLWVRNGGTFDLRASAYSHQGSTVASQTVAGSGTASLSFTLSKLKGLSGTVRDGSGNAIAGAQILVSNSNFSSGAVSDSYGAYSTVGLPAGAYTVTASASGQPDTTLSNIDAAASIVNITMGAAAVRVSLTPASVSLNQSASQQFTAAVSGSTNTGVTWSLSPNVGTLVNGLYTAPSTISSAQTVTVIATSSADPSKSATASITLNPPPPGGVQVTISPSTVTMAPGGSYTFAAQVTGTTNTGVTWSFSPMRGFMTSDGRYIAPIDATSTDVITVTATSVADPTKTASCTVNFAQAVTISINPPTANLASGQSAQFSATVSGTSNTGVTWSVSPQIGSVSSSGLYSAPASISSSQTVTVTATSTASGKSASAFVNLTAPIPVSIAINPPAASLTNSQSVQFSASVTGTSNTPVTWSINPQLGSISAGGVYTAPATMAGPAAVVVTATSVADSTKSASATVTLSPTISVQVSPGNVSLSNSQSVQFVANVGGVTNTAVTWSISPQLGSISASGVYTAPASMAGPAAVTVVATSAADATKSASATVNLSPTISVQVSPAAISLTSGQTAQFTANVGGTTTTGVVWSLNPPVGSISPTGLYTAPGTLSGPASVTVTATSAADASKSASAVISLAPAAGITVALNPPSVTMASTSSIQFSVSVSGTSNTAVTWTMSPALGFLTSSGSYTAPYTLSPQTVTITATSVADPTKSATSVVTVQPKATILINPGAIQLSAGQLQQYTARVLNLSSGNVLWSVTQGRGSITSAGVYTAPSAVTTYESVVITATSTIDPTVWASTTVLLTP